MKQKHNWQQWGTESELGDKSEDYRTIKCNRHQIPAMKTIKKKEIISIDKQWQEVFA